MNKELEIWQFAARRLKQNESAMLVVVAESSGSSPGRQGFKMIVTGDETCGSIGGGVMEINLVELAREQLKTSVEQAFVKTQIHRKNSPNPSGMICSGKQTIVFFKLSNAHLKSVRKLTRWLKNQRESYFQITKNDFQLERAKEYLEDFAFEITDSGDVENSDFIYREKLGYKNKLFIIGGGHCALALSELMSKMDFHISLYDDRADLNTLDKNQFVHKKVIVDSYEKIGDFIESSENVFVVVMTLGYKYDRIVIEKLIDKDFKYFGVLGSKAKMATLLRELKKEGFDAEKLSQIKTPIGLPINSRTPEEIAVSIAAEIIAVKNKAA